jgi:hypothetical protein
LQWRNNKESDNDMPCFYDYSVLNNSDKTPPLGPLGFFKRQAGALSLRIQAAHHPKTRDLYMYMFHFN